MDEIARRIMVKQGADALVVILEGVAVLEVESIVNDVLHEVADRFRKSGREASSDIVKAFMRR